MDVFHASTKAWLGGRYRTPTQARVEAWPLSAMGHHVLVSAPTGTGKTMAAFMWPLDQLISGRWSLGSTSVLYVSPLKALNNDIQHNLLLPLAELRSQYFADGIPWHKPKVMTRSGDTSATDRRRMQRQMRRSKTTRPAANNTPSIQRGQLSHRLSTQRSPPQHIHPARRPTNGRLPRAIQSPSPQTNQTTQANYY